MNTPINPYMYAKQITRVKDVYGRFYWLATNNLNNPDRLLIPICSSTGLKRMYTKAGEKDSQNMLHRANIAETRETKEILP